MSENPLSAILPVPGSGSTSGPGNSGSSESGAANGAAEMRPEHRKARGRGVPGSCESCGKPWPCPPEAAHRRRLRASSAHLKDQPIIAGDWLPPEYLLGVADTTPPAPENAKLSRQDRVVAAFLIAFTAVILACIVSVGWNAVTR